MGQYCPVGQMLGKATKEGQKKLIGQKIGTRAPAKITPQFLSEIVGQIYRVIRINPIPNGQKKRAAQDVQLNLDPKYPKGQLKSGITPMRDTLVQLAETGVLDWLAGQITAAVLITVEHA